MPVVTDRDGGLFAEVGLPDPPKRNAAARGMVWTWRLRDGRTLTLICADSEQIRQELRGQARVLVADPPYGIGYRPHGGAGVRPRSEYAIRSISGDNLPFNPAPWLSLGFERHAFFGANHFSSRLPDSDGWIVWDKRGEGGSNDTSDAELIWTDCAAPVRTIRHIWRGMIRASERGAYYHPTQKPVAVLVALFDIMRLQELRKGGIGLTVIDPFVGSGSTLLACAAARGLHGIGVEIDEAMCSVAVDRISKELALEPVCSNLSDSGHGGINIP